MGDQSADRRVQVEIDVADKDLFCEKDRRPNYGVVAPGGNTHGSGSINQAHDAAPEFPVALLFSQIYVDETILFRGLRLFAEQPAVADSGLEQRKQPGREPTGPAIDGIAITTSR